MSVAEVLTSVNASNKLDCACGCDSDSVGLFSVTGISANAAPFAMSLFKSLPFLVAPFEEDSPEGSLEGEPLIEGGGSTLVEVSLSALMSAGVRFVFVASSGDDTLTSVSLSELSVISSAGRGLSSNCVIVSEEVFVPKLSNGSVV